MRPLCATKLGVLIPSRWLSSICLLVTIPTLAEESPHPDAAGWQGETVREALHEDAELQIFRCAFPPGVSHKRHFHPRHFGYAVSRGQMRITSDSGTCEVTLKTGSYFFSGGIVWSEGLNAGDTAVSYLMIEPREPFISCCTKFRIRLAATSSVSVNRSISTLRRDTSSGFSRD